VHQAIASFDRRSLSDIDLSTATALEDATTSQLEQTPNNKGLPQG
jgi:hypothetical protein